MSFRMSCFLVEMPANAVVKKNNKNEMSKTFFIFFSIPKDLFFGESNIYHDLGVFYKEVGFTLRVRSSRPKMESNTKSITSQFNLTHFWNFVFN